MKLPSKDNPDGHAEARDAKRRKQTHLTDNRKSVRLIAKLSIQSDKSRVLPKRSTPPRD